jgi:hypothetical protein
MCHASNRAHTRSGAFNDLTILLKISSAKTKPSRRSPRASALRAGFRTITTKLVEPGRIELPTSCVQGRRSPS